MSDEGLHLSLEPPVEEEESTPDKLKAWARTVVGSAFALITLVLFLVLSGLLAIWLDKRGLGVIWSLTGGLVAAPIAGAIVFQVFYRWKKSWDLIAALARQFPTLLGFPPVQDILAEKRRLQAIEYMVDRIECLVGFYHLKGFFAGQIASPKGFPQFIGTLRSMLIQSIPATVDPEDSPAALIAALAKVNPAWKATTCSVLNLLYQERQNRCDSAVWQRFRRDDEDDQALRLLAEALSGSGKLPGWSAEDLATVLRDMDEFSWDRLRDHLHELDDVAGKAAAYLGFLKENGVSLWDKRPPVGELKQILTQAQALRFGEPKTRRDAMLLVQVGRNAIGEALARKAALAQSEPPLSNELREDAEGPMLRRYALLAAILYLTRISPRDLARERLCLDLAAEPQDEGVRLAWAYLELKHDFRSEQRPADRPFFSFADLVESWRSHLDRAAAKPYLLDELKELRSILEDGKWVNRLSDLLKQAQSDRLKQQLPPLTVPSKKDDVARQVVKRYKLDHRPELLNNLVRQVDLETLARNLEAGRFIPYLITFRADRGPLSRLIDYLTMPKKLGQAEIKTEIEYEFRPYTENARIGLVPEGWSFEQLREAFQRDFTKVLDARTKLLRQGAVDLDGIEIMLHRFSALGRCAFDSPLSRRVALSNLTDLLVEKLPPDKLVALVQASTAVSLKDYALSASIPDLVGDEAPLTTAESKLLESQDGQIKNELLGGLHAKNIPQLARRLSQQNIDHAKATEALAKLLERHVPQFNARRSTHIADVYLNGLESLAAA